VNVAIRGSPDVQPVKTIHSFKIDKLKVLDGFEEMD